MKKDITNHIIMGTIITTAVVILAFIIALIIRYMKASKPTEETLRRFADKTIPRGYRNNNPLNIRAGRSRWMGAASSETGSFVTFLTVAYGYRAAWKLLSNYHRYYRLWTLRQVINRWAPPKENNTNAYLKRVVEISGLNPDAGISFREKQKMIDLAYAMTIVENGKAVEREIIEQGYELMHNA